MTDEEVFRELLKSTSRSEEKLDHIIEWQKNHQTNDNENFRRLNWFAIAITLSMVAIGGPDVIAIIQSLFIK